MSDCLKPFKTFSDQLSILKKRGLIVEDDEAALGQLECLNYYRLSGYTFMRMDRSKNTFLAGTTFDQIIGLYEFDENLRYLIIPLIESIELAVRCQLSYNFSQAHHDPHTYPNNDAHYHVSNFCDLRKHEHIFGTILPDQIEKHRCDLFVAKHINSYNGKMPLWVIVEILSFTGLSFLYDILLKTEQDTIARFFHSTRFYMPNWLNVMVVLRNKCAHYGRLYGVKISPPVHLPLVFKQNNPAVTNNSLFAALYIALLMAPPTFSKGAFVDALDRLIDRYNNIISMDELLFPKNWKTILKSVK